MPSSALPSELPATLCEIGQRIVHALRSEAMKYVNADALPDIRLDAARFTQRIDPASGQAGYEGFWRNALNERCGRIVFNGDGSFFAEYDLCVPHPFKRGWFIEAVTAWGRAEMIKAEARMLAML